MKKDLDHQECKVFAMMIMPLIRAGFMFEGSYPTNKPQLPNDLTLYPHHWCLQIPCMNCNLKCKYCCNKSQFNQNNIISHFNQDVIPYLVSRIRQYGPINTFVYSVGEPGLFTSDIAKIIQQCPSDQFRHCIKTNGSFVSDDLIEDIYVINTDIKGNPDFYNRITQRIGFFEDILEPHLQWLVDVSIPEKELTYAIWLWHNDDEETRQLILKYVDQIEARLVLNVIRSVGTFDAGYERSLLNKDVYERVCDIYLWFKDYGVEPVVRSLKKFEPNKNLKEL